jgi:hypothetical protein
MDGNNILCPRGAEVVCIGKPVSMAELWVSGSVAMSLIVRLGFDMGLYCIHGLYSINY